MGTIIAFSPREVAGGTIAPRGLCRALVRDPYLVVLDVRGMREFFSGAAGRLPMAINVPLALLAACIRDLRSLRKRRMVLVCANGTHAMQAAAQLRSAGFEDVAALRGGMELWARLGYPRQLPPISRTAA